MKLRLPSRLVQALLTSCAVALTTNAPVFADVPEDYAPVIITNVDQLADYTESDYVAFIISADITDSAYRMSGAHQYWVDDVLHSHVLTFAELESGSPGAALYIGKELDVQQFEQLCFARNITNVYLRGGAIYANSSSTVSFTENGTVTFSENSASDGGAIYAHSSSTVNFTDNDAVTFSENSAYDGGAIYANSSTVNFTDNDTVTFSGNSTSSFGGAIYAYSSSTVNFTDNDAVTFSENSAQFGGAIYASGTFDLTGNTSV
ncbi:MAG: hypothetical protein Q4C88_01025, partial [Akkermansia sp.]|nr:hypothetical protein [Akkermansia sp.]